LPSRITISTSSLECTTGIPRLTTPRLTTLFNCHYAPELEALASQLPTPQRHDVTVRIGSHHLASLCQFAYKHVSFCISVIRSVIKGILLDCLHYNFILLFLLWLQFKKKKAW
jgi:hypothetical protein